MNWPRMDKQLLREIPQAILTRTLRGSPSLPRNSSFLTSRCITAHMTRRLLQVAKAIREDGTTPSHEALILGLASAIEPLSRTRKDGRALRIVTKPRTTISSVLTARWNSIIEDVGLMQHSLGSVPIPEVLLGDGRRPASRGIPLNSQDLVYTSPPYPNNIDYTEVYKLELWLLGYVTNASEFLQLRRQSFRSHPTSGLEDPCKDFIVASRRGRLGSLLSPIVARIADLKVPWRRRVLLGYFSDLWTTLEECHRVLRHDGHAVFVVGNSLHGAATNPYLIPTDLVLGAIAEKVGFRVERTIAARPLRRRLSGNHFLRESLVVLRRWVAERNKLSFEASAYLQTLIGRELFQREDFALVELIKNSYDSGAPKSLSRSSLCRRENPARSRCSTMEAAWISKRSGTTSCSPAIVSAPSK